MSPKSSKNKLATEIADKAVASHPKVPTMQLARIMMKKHPHVFPSINSARCAIRYRRGAMGKRTRSAAVAVTPPSIFSSTNPLGLPESSARENEPFVMDGVSKCLTIADLHMPYHDMQALTVALRDGIRNEVDGVLINGDLLDFHTISRFGKDPGARRFKEERDTAKAFLSRLRELFPKARIVFKEGNHDERLRIFVMEKAPELYDEEILGLPVLLGLDKLGIEHVYDKRAVMLGKLPILHGHELPRGITNPVSPARTAFLRAKVSVMVSHSHKVSESNETTLDRELITSWSTGCLCGLFPLFEPNNSWGHGHAIIDVQSNGHYRVRNVRTHDGEMLN